MASKAAEIMDALAAELATITKAGGYLTDAGLRVLRERAARSAEAVTLPALALRPTGEQVLERQPGRARVSLGIAIEALVAADDGYETALLDVAHDVRRVLMRTDVGAPALGGLAQYVQLEAVEYAQPLEGSDIAVAEITATAVYVDTLEG